MEDARERVTLSSPTRSGKDYSHASDHPSNRPGLRCRGGRRRCLTSCSGGDRDANDEFQEKVENPDDNVITDTDDRRIVKKKTEITFMSGRPPTTAENWDDVACVAKAEEITGLHINWGLVPSEGVSEK